MLSDDIAFVDLELQEVAFGIDFVEAWRRIKAALVESTNSSHNKQSTPCFHSSHHSTQAVISYCPKCGDVIG